jgi:hypothetical protein
LVKELFDKFIPLNPRSAGVLLPPSYDDDRTTSALQVADTLAYETRKGLTSKIRNPADDYMRVPMKRLLPTVCRIYKLNYKSLANIVANQSGDSIPIHPARVEELLGKDDR